MNGFAKVSAKPTEPLRGKRPTGMRCARINSVRDIGGLVVTSALRGVSEQLCDVQKHPQ